MNGAAFFFRVSLVLTTWVTTIKADDSVCLDGDMTCTTIIGMEDPFPKWDVVMTILTNRKSDRLEVKGFSHTSDDRFCILYNDPTNTGNQNEMICVGESFDFLTARSSAVGSGELVKSMEFNGPDRWFIQWGENAYDIEGYPELEATLAAAQTAANPIRYISTVLGSRDYVVL